MNGPTHREVTEKAIRLLAKEHSDFSYKIGTAPLMASAETISTETDAMLTANSKSDHKNDLEFIDVESNRDNPHEDSASCIDDVARYSTKEFSEKIADVKYDFTSFQHFIDLGHKGIYDDYDGYSYRHGSACENEYEPGFHARSGWVRKGFFSSKGTLDADINYYFNDEYVHAPGMKWYRNCSPAVWHYTFCEHFDKYFQILQRYPLAQGTGKRNCGIPYSVLTPVDNMGRFWYERFLISGNLVDLGPVMHAIQDACVPHHTSGYMGNWHEKYENCLENEFSSYKDKCDSSVLNLYRKWSKNGGSSPNKITYPASRTMTPNKSWRIDHLITWLACQSHYQYINDYNHFNNDSWQKKESFTNNKKPRELLDLAVAMSMLVLEKAKAEYIHRTGKEKVESISITIYAPKSSASDIDLQMRLYYNYCGGCIEFPISKDDNSLKTIGNTKHYVYQKTFSLANMNIDTEQFRLELGRDRLKQFGFYYTISYKTADRVNHTYADTYSSKKITYFKDDRKCIPLRTTIIEDTVPLPRMDITRIKSVRIASSLSKRYNARSNDPVYLEIESPEYDTQYIELNLNKSTVSRSLAKPIDAKKNRIFLAIHGDDAWLPKTINIEFYDDHNNKIFSFSKTWPDHLWLARKSRVGNKPSYLLIENGVDVF